MVLNDLTVSVPAYFSIMHTYQIWIIIIINSTLLNIFKLLGFSFI